MLPSGPGGYPGYPPAYQGAYTSFPQADFGVPQVYPTQAGYATTNKRYPEPYGAGYPPQSPPRGHFSATSEFGHEAKKPKTGVPANSVNTIPKKTLHVRSLPPDATEEEVRELFIPLGSIKGAFILKGKNQAFVEFNDLESAKAAFEYYQKEQAVIRKRQVHVQFSLKDEILQDIPNHIILITVSEPHYPITVELLKEVLSKYGNVHKIVLFSKNSSVQALCQFDTIGSASNARTALEGQYLFAGCCQMHINYSPLPNLNVRYNNEKSRDYTNPELPVGPTPQSTSSQQQAVHIPQLTPQIKEMAENMARQMGVPVSMVLNPTIFGSYYNAAFSSPNPPLPQIPSQQAGSTTSGHGSVIIVGGLDDKDPNTDELFNLFGVYGNVERVKILYQRKDTALIQFENPTQAALAIQHLSGCIFHGRPIQVNPSKHTHVQLPFAGTTPVNPGEATLTKDYTNHPQHRFKSQKSKTYQHITAPTAVLHVANLPPTIDENDLQNLFQKYGTVTGLAFSPKDRKMALVQMASVPEAIHALVNTHNYVISDNPIHTIRVSFSRSSPSTWAAPASV